MPLCDPPTSGETDRRIILLLDIFIYTYVFANIRYTYPTIYIVIGQLDIYLNP